PRCELINDRHRRACNLQAPGNKCVRAASPVCVQKIHDHTSEDVDLPHVLLISETPFPFHLLEVQRMRVEELESDCSKSNGSYAPIALLLNHLGPTSARVRN